MLSLILFSALIVLSESRWSRAVPLHDSAHISISPGIATSTSSSSFILLATILRSSPNRTPHYGYKAHNSTLGTFQSINKDFGCVYGNIINIVRNELYTVCMGTRTAGSSMAKCDGYVNDGCSEVFFMESRGGAWSSPKPISRSDMSDVANRAGASIVQSEKTERIFIFYSTNDVFGKSYISYVTRPKGSSSFNSETHICEADGQLFDRSVVSAITSSREQLVHVAWNENGNLYYTSSSNNGISWDSKALISSVVSISQDMASLQFLTFKPKLDFAFLLYITKEHKGEIRWADSRLSDPKAKTAVIANDLQYVNGAVCEGAGKIVIIGKGVDMMLQGFVFDMNNASVVTVLSPFEGEFMYEFPQVVCEAKENNQATVKVVAYDARDQMEYLTIGEINL
eukprot:TRINITY_DN10596_c0_g1_i3.p1 TRINITY_DN10596_c0_g1~~TRINITY_DN10596_c0_g1_i3.p1  ORF type:complete len:420 (-),score=50.64 TRINITY_DN10596_c0_g1_i3:170-1363(-)